jgi:signal transduction histidine kinase
MSTGRAPRVLVVDDDEDQLELIGRRLTDAGFCATLARTAEQALALLAGHSLLLVDYALPGMTGIDLLHRVVETDGPPVVMVTGMGSEQTAVDAMRAGAIDYVVKERGYLASLPQVVERAWRAHDLAQRAGELQRLALLVTSATERAELLREIVRGARRLLRAEACMLFVAGPAGSLLVGAVDGDVPHEHDPAPDVGRMLAGGPAALAVPGKLLVRLPAADHAQLGVLAMLDSGESASAEEVRLAETFAAFAGIALEKLHRLELERALVEEMHSILELRRDVVASVSHEFRVPLTCIRGFSELLLGSWPTICEDERRALVGKINHHSEMLASLVDTLLDFGALESGRFVTNVGELDLAREVRDTIEDMAPMLGGRLIEAAIPPLRIVADSDLVRRIVSNLLSNAVKYSDAGTPVTIRTRIEGGHVRVVVEDLGPGMGESDAARVFEPFWRSRHAVSQAVRGSGIGLALVKEYARVLGGQVGVESQPGVGSTFWFTIPLADSSSLNVA